MKLILPMFFLISVAWGLDYDPKFHIKHRYNNHEQVVKDPSLPKAQKMEASETSPKPLQTTPNMRTSK